MKKFIITKAFHHCALGVNFPVGTKVQAEFNDTWVKFDIAGSPTNSIITSLKNFKKHTKEILV